FKSDCGLVDAEKNDECFSHESLEDGMCLETPTGRNATSQRSWQSVYEQSLSGSVTREKLPDQHE
ncbi:MAG: hypothetical protein SCH68_10340, partial [Brevefilum sp.]|nr:hypothetical protein [Brevefilum sp.]